MVRLGSRASRVNAGRIEGDGAELKVTRAFTCFPTAVEGSPVAFSGSFLRHHRRAELKVGRIEGDANR